MDEEDGEGCWDPMKVGADVVCCDLHEGGYGGLSSRGVKKIHTLTAWSCRPEDKGASGVGDGVGGEGGTTHQLFWLGGECGQIQGRVDLGEWSSSDGRMVRGWIIGVRRARTDLCVCHEGGVVSHLRTKDQSAPNTPQSVDEYARE